MSSVITFGLNIIAIIEVYLICARGGFRKGMSKNDLYFSLICSFSAVWTIAYSAMINADSQMAAYTLRAIGLFGMHGAILLSLLFEQHMLGAQFEEEGQNVFKTYLIMATIATYICAIIPDAVTFVRTTNGLFFYVNNWIGAYVQLLYLVFYYFFWFDFIYKSKRHIKYKRDAIIERCYIESGFLLVAGAVLDIMLPLLSNVIFFSSNISVFFVILLVFKTCNVRGVVDSGHEGLLEYCYENVDISYLILNADFMVGDANLKAGNVLDVTRDRLFGSYFFDWFKVIPDDRISDIRAEIANRLEKIMLPNVVTRYTELDVTLEFDIIYDRYGQAASVFVVIHDRSQEDEYKMAIEAGLREVELANKVKQSFLTRITGGLRDPLENILDCAVSLESEVPEMTRPRINQIRENASSLLGTMNDIIDIASMESKNFVLENIKYDIKDLLSSVMSECAEKLNESEVVLISVINASMPRELIGDSVRIRQVLYNLLDNAVKYTEHGYITLQVEYRVHYRKVMLNFSVSDTGMGIKKESMETIFGVLNEADEGVLGSMGNGLGLSLCRNIIKNMGGEISVRSAFGRGTTFNFSFEQKIDSEKSVVPFMEFHESVLLLQTDQICLDAQEKILKEMGLFYESVLIKDLLISDSIPDSGNYTVIFAQIDILRRHRQIIKRNYPDVRIISIYNYHEYQRLENKTDAICAPLFFDQISDVLREK